MAIFYCGAGINHFLNPGFYMALSPKFLPHPEIGNIAGGIAEIILGLLLLYEPTRRASAYLIIAMLVVFFFVIHIPITIQFYQGGDHRFFWSLLRCPVQIPLITWAYAHARRKPL
jgi:uncharacterized membrane protein